MSTLQWMSEFQGYQQGRVLLYLPCRGVLDPCQPFWIHSHHCFYRSIMSGYSGTASDTIHFSCTPFDMFKNARGDALAEFFFDSMMPEMMNLDLFSSVPIPWSSKDYDRQTVLTQSIKNILWHTFMFSSTQHQLAKHTFCLHKCKTSIWFLYHSITAHNNSTHRLFQIHALIYIYIAHQLIHMY